MNFIYYIFQSIAENVAFITASDVLDIIVVAAMIYIILLFIKRTQSFFIFNSLIFLLVLRYLAQLFHLDLTSQILQPLFTFFGVIVIVVYQREIRKLFDWFSQPQRNLSFLREITISGEISSVLVKALSTMAEERVGAIIILSGEYPLEQIVAGGFPLEGKVSVPLLLSIFDSHSPGHDGAVLIKNNVIKGFGFQLPLAEEYDKYDEFGTRHRAAVGITEHSDALAIVVSEEKGTISIATAGHLETIHDTEELEGLIKGFLKENIPEEHSVWWLIFFKDVWLKFGALSLAVVLWFAFVYH